MSKLTYSEPGASAPYSSNVQPFGFEVHEAFRSKAWILRGREDLCSCTPALTDVRVLEGERGERS
jgi:hypothetical protein